MKLVRILVDYAKLTWVVLSRIANSFGSLAGATITRSTFIVNAASECCGHSCI